jgi:hypothetical protein
MIPKEFKPRYEFLLLIALVFSFSLGIPFFIRGILRFDISMLIVGGLLLYLGMLILSRFPRVIYFDSHEIIIKYWFWVSTSLDYREITDISPLGVFFRKKLIPFEYMKNANELDAIFKSLMQNGTIHQEQMKGTWHVRSILFEKTFRLASIPVIVICFLVKYLLQAAFFIKVDFMEVFLVASVVIFPITYQIIKRNYEAKHNFGD